MKPTVDQLQTLLAARRVERPDEGYWQDFLSEFHRRQREAAVAEPWLMGAWRRICEFFSDMGTAKWAYGAGLAYAAVTAAFLLAPAKVDVVRDGAVPTVTKQSMPAANQSAPNTPLNKNAPNTPQPPVNPVF